MTPQTVNAYYNPSMNESCSRPPSCRRPSSIRPPTTRELRRYRQHHRPRDQPRHDNSRRARLMARAVCATGGRPPTARRFQKLCADLVKQWYGQYEVPPGKKLNGQLTLGENIADLSGLQMAFKGLPAVVGRAARRPRSRGLHRRAALSSWAGPRPGARKCVTRRALQLLLDRPHSPTRFPRWAPWSAMTASTRHLAPGRRRALQRSPGSASASGDVPVGRGHTPVMACLEGTRRAMAVKRQAISLTLAFKPGSGQASGIAPWALAPRRQAAMGSFQPLSRQTTIRRVLARPSIRHPGRCVPVIARPVTWVA